MLNENCQIQHFMKIAKFDALYVSFGDLIDPEQNFVLYCDRIAFQSTISI